jgi:hypothetical protein
MQMKTPDIVPENYIEVNKKLSMLDTVEPLD